MHRCGPRGGCAPRALLLLHGLLLGLLLPGGVSSAQADCAIYTEAFDSFAGPHDLDDGAHQVRWCEGGAAVASGSFCPTGNAFKLDSGTDAPVVWFRSSSDCTSVTIEFDYSQFVATNTQLRYAVTNDATFDCTRSITQSAGMLTEAGGACTHVTHTAALSAGQSVYWMFDHGGGSNALFIDSVTITVGGCCADDAQQPCCETGGAGCADPDIQACVCAEDPFCCDVQWDELCVDEVKSLGCGSCTAPADCMTGLAMDFGDLFASGSVCSLFPGAFEHCQGNGPYISSSTACGGTGDMAMTFGAGFPYSAAVTNCIDLTDVASAQLEFQWTKDTGTLGPRVDITTDGKTFTTLWTAPTIVDGQQCTPASIDLNAYIGEPAVRLRFASGSSVHNGAAIDDIVLTTSDEAVHGCCETGGPGCADTAIQDCVCAIDPFCCDVQWDELCVISAEFYGCGDCGLCVDELDTDFGAEFVGGDLCDVFPELFVLCQGSGPWLTTGTACGDADDIAVLFGSGAELSAVVTRCLDLADVAEAALQFSYTKVDGTVGPVVEISLDAGGSFAPIWTAPDAPGAGCHDVCIDLSEFAGLPYVHLAFHNGDPSTSGAAIDDIHLLRGSGCSTPQPEPSPDLDGNGVVDVFDLLELLSAWGPCTASPQSCPADLDSNGTVDVFDLLELLSAWG